MCESVLVSLVSEFVSVSVSVCLCVYVSLSLVSARKHAHVPVVGAFQVSLCISTRDHYRR